MIIETSFGVIFVIFFFKQKTAYEMRISDWSSDVCSSDLAEIEEAKSKLETAMQKKDFKQCATLKSLLDELTTKRATIKDDDVVPDVAALSEKCKSQIGRASCRERVCQYV